MLEKAVQTNANPYLFDEYVTSLATVMSFSLSGSMDRVVGEYQALFRRALEVRPSFAEVTELTGNCANAADKRGGQAAWILMNTVPLRVCGVNCQVWHRQRGQNMAPLADQLSHTIGVASQLSEDHLQGLGNKAGTVDVVGTRGREIWLVQAVWSRSRLLSATGERFLFGGRVFRDPYLPASSAETLGRAINQLQMAFPNFAIKSRCIVLDPTGCDFELYKISAESPFGKLRLADSDILDSSLNYREQLLDNSSALLELPDRLQQESFRGLPPCRGGRTLAMLACFGREQMQASSLLTWRECDVIQMLREEFGHFIPRDKIRHDLIDRMISQGFVRKSEDRKYFLSIKGLGRYLYCLAKYAKGGLKDPMEVLEACSNLRDMIHSRIGYVP